MKVLAVILARGGSKGIKRKNVIKIGGVPLIGRTVSTCLACEVISDVVVSTDDVEIATIAREFGAEVVERPAEYATDSSSSESALLHVCETWGIKEGRDYDLLMLAQNTTPFHSELDMTAVVQKMANGNCNSCITVTKTWRYHWAECDNGWEMPNQKRGNRQHRSPWFVEAGSLYCVQYKLFCQTMDLFAPPVEAVEIPELRSIELDEPEDIDKIRALAKLYDIPK